MHIVLVISDFFPPGFAPRLGYIVKYLREYGYEAIILSTDILTREDNADFSHLVSYPRARYIVSSSEAEQKAYLKTQKNSIKKLKHFIKPDYNRPPGLNEKMIKVGLEVFKKYNIELILSSTSSIFPMSVAHVLSSRFNVPWVADVRDVIEQGFYKSHSLRDKIVKLRTIIRRGYLIRHADYVTTISNWHCRKLKNKNKHIELIYNGFDPELFFEREPIKTEKFTIIYTGTILTVRHYQDPILFFSALKKLKEDGVISVSNFQIIFYTYRIGIEYIKGMAQNFNVLEYFTFHEFVTAAQVPDLLHKSSILLMFAKRTSKGGPKGVLTTKLFEYMATRRPILCIESDYSDIEKIILELGLGLAARDEREVYEFIKTKYNEWLRFGFTLNNVENGVAMESYSRQQQAKRFSQIFDHLIESRH